MKTNLVKPILLTLLVLIVFYPLVCCSSEEARQKAVLTESLQELLNSQIRGDIHSAFLLVDIPGKDFKFKSASGEFAPGTNTPLDPDDMFRIASVTKTFTATIVFQLIEEGKLSLDDTLDKYFPSELVDRIHVYEGESYGYQITIQHLLTHTSGLPDHAGPTSIERFIERILGDPQHHWNPMEMVELSLEFSLKPHCKPSEEFHYSDDGFILLGLIIEKVTGNALHEEYRSRIFEPLGMTQIFLESYEELPPKGIAHPFIKDYDASEISGSVDWAGGGLVSNTENLDIFINALLDGKLFKNKETLEMMLEEGGYGYGIESRNFGDDLGYGHSGFWSTYMYKIPGKNITICASLNQAYADGRKFLKKVWDLVTETLYQ
ncbi:MAG: serine hydrolase [Deltaproteobacteria bacterium]|nr:serine hydrolase [Deltaproteobacteria bacterium]